MKEFLLLTVVELTRVAFMISEMIFFFNKDEGMLIFKFLLFNVAICVYVRLRIGMSEYVDEGKYEDFINSQKIIYELKSDIHELNIPEQPDGFKEGKYFNNIDLKLPFIKLLNGKEPLNNVKLRYELYLKNWERQKNAIDLVLLKTDRFRFRSLKKFLSFNSDNDSDNESLQQDNRLITSLLNLGSNISNHDRLLTNLCNYLNEDDDLCLIKVNPNVCFNIQKIIKLIEDFIIVKIKDIKKNEELYESINNERIQQILEFFDKGSKYIDIEDMINIFKIYKIRLIILIQNADAMNSNLIEQLLYLLNKFNSICKVRIIIGISTPFIIFQDKISKNLINKLRTKNFSIDNSNETINQIMEDLLLNINETYNSLIFDPKLVLKFLNKRDKISIQQFNNYMKLIYMRHYFNQPLSLFWTNDFSKIDLNNIYFKIFKILPSVIENSLKFDKKYLLGILNNNYQIIGELLRINLNKLIDWRFNFRNLIEFLNFIHAFLINKNDKIWLNNLELFKLLFEKYYDLRDNYYNLNDFEEYEDVDLEDSGRKRKRVSNTNSSNTNYKINPDHLLKFLQPIWNNIENMNNEEINKFYKQIKEDEQFKFISQNNKYPINEKTINCNKMIKIIKLSLRDQICDLDLDNQAFREICVINEDLIFKIHENFEPCIRDNLLNNLQDPVKVIFNSRHFKKNEDNEDEIQMFHLIEPIICETYRILKETGVSINIYDFYQVFKNNIIMKKEIIELMRKKIEKDDIKDKKEMIDILDKITFEDSEKETEWSKLTLSWFLKSISEMQILGLVKEGNNNKSQNIEKVIWKGI